MKSIILALLGSRTLDPEELVRRICMSFPTTRVAPLTSFTISEPFHRLLFISNEKQLTELMIHSKNVAGIFLRQPSEGLLSNELVKYQLIDDGDLQKTVAQITGILFREIERKVTIVDGTALAGKSTVAERLAIHTNASLVSHEYVVRSFIYEIAIKQGLRLNEKKLAQILQTLEEKINPWDVTKNKEELYAKAVTNRFNEWMHSPLIQESVNWVMLKAYRLNTDLVVDGVGMGIHPFPFANHKFFLNCKRRERANRLSDKNMRDVCDNEQALIKTDNLQLKLRYPFDVVHVDSGGQQNETFKKVITQLKAA